MDYKEKLRLAKEALDSGSYDKETIEYIFPELAKSEGERIRKVLIDYFNRYKEQEECGVKTFYGIPTDDILAWLEEQGEHANFRNKIQIGDKVTRNQDGILINLSQLNRVAKKDEKQGDQKSIWHNEDEEPQKDSLILLIMQSGTPIVAKIINSNHTFNHGERWAYIDAWLEKRGEQKPYGLREECKDCQCNYAGECKGSCAMKRNEQNPTKVPKFKAGDFIQFNGMGHTRYTIKEVCGLSHYINTCDKRMDMSYTDANFELVEQKPTWSEEDEEIYRKCICAMRASACGFPEEEKFVEQVDDWFKSLKDRVQAQSTWKPSEEQMIALKCAITTADEKWVCMNTKDLESLYQDLKKLKE